MKRDCLECGGEFEAVGSGIVCIDCIPHRIKVQLRVQGQVARAVREGKLLSLRAESVPCVDCGNRAACYDHRDYAKPVDVEPVCRSCNLRRPPAPSTRGIAA